MECVYCLLTENDWNDVVEYYWRWKKLLHIKYSFCREVELSSKRAKKNFRQFIPCSIVYTHTHHITCIWPERSHKLFFVIRLQNDIHRKRKREREMLGDVWQQRWKKLYTTCTIMRDKRHMFWWRYIYIIQLILMNLPAKRINGRTNERTNGIK